MSNATIIDEKVFGECLNEITRALMQSDVKFEMIRDMMANIKRIVNLKDLAAGHDKRRIIQQVIHYEKLRISFSLPLSPNLAIFILVISCLFVYVI
ncbi:hypothetical protein KSP40_PGU020736 [Platanthera guangdongensis]|uniref:Signal recognition particle SRP54 helical bundle domain-containing protein n=1 Tax=Platanthera guangdongensis TaxID=2320717 RepID=A0ABR2M261_9ASPA